MRFTIKLPDGKEVQVDGNFATEDSIRELSAALRADLGRANRDLGDLSSRSRAASDDINDLGSAAGDASDDINDISAASNRYAAMTKKLVGTVGDVVKNFGQLKFTMRDAATGNLDFGDIISTTGGAVGGALGMIPGPIGKFAGGLVTATAGLAGFAIGIAEGLRDLNKGLFESGMMIKGGMDSFANAANDARIPINEFGNALLKNRNVLRLFAGGAPGGINNISKAFKILRDDLGDLQRDLFSMGYSTEDIVGAMADYGAAAAMAGEKLSPDQLAQDTGKYLKNLRELSRLTGQDVDSIREKMSQDRANLFIQRQLLGLNEKQRPAMESFLGALPPALGPMRDFILSGQSLTTESGIMVSQFPTFANILREAAQGIRSGAFDAQQAQDFITNKIKENNVILTNEQRSVIETFGVAGAEQIKHADMLGQASLSVSEMKTAAEANGDAFNTNKDEVVGLTSLFGTMHQTVNDVTALLQSTFIDGLKLVDGPLGSFATGLSTAIDWLQKLKDNIAAWFGAKTPEEAAAAKDKLTTRATNLIESIINRITNTFTGLFDIMKNKIKEAFTEVLPGWVKALGFGAETASEKAAREERELVGELSELSNQIQVLKNTVASAPAQDQASFFKKQMGVTKEDYDKRLAEAEAKLANKIKAATEKGYDPNSLLGTSEANLTETEKIEAARLQSIIEQEARNQAEKEAAEASAFGYDKGGFIKPNTIGIVGEIGPEIVRGPASVTSRIETREILERAAAEPRPEIEPQRDQLTSLQQAIQTGNATARQMLGAMEKINENLRIQTGRIDALVETQETANRINRGIGFARA